MIIVSPYIILNGMRIKGVQSSLLEFDLETVAPKWVSPIHGDLTFENILFNKSTGDFKLIDPAGSRFVDAFELDIAKCMQSFISKYELWNTYNTIISVDRININIPEEFLVFDLKSIKELLMYESDEESKCLIKKILFFLATHLIRLIPYTIDKSRERALFSLSLSAFYLNYASNIDDNKNIMCYL